MDLVASCKDKLAHFRIRELKDVLTKLSLGKQGKKQELMDRIVSALSDEKVVKMQCRGWKNHVGKEEIAKIIDETFRKMQIHGAADAASKGQCDPDVNDAMLKRENHDSPEPTLMFRCPCGSSYANGRMIQCDDPKCGVWQHFGCVIIQEKPMDCDPPNPPQFFCEMCRLNRADPFWVTVEHLLPPVKLVILDPPTEGTNPMQNVEKIFYLRADVLSRSEYEVQVWCILLNDKVPFRMQWPQFADLHVNGVTIRATNRPGSLLLGANGRDDGPLVTTCAREGMNNISLSACDTRVFCMGVRIVKRRSLYEVLGEIPSEQDGEPFEDALARVYRCIGGGNAAENADSDSDLEVVADSVTISLRCPMSGSRMKVAGRFRPCAHMGCFDLGTFVELNQRSRKWQCPICLKNYSLENVIIDPYFNRITTMMLECGEDVNEIDVKPDGSWRAKNETDCPHLAQWHFPDGSLCPPMDKEAKPNLGSTKHIKEEGLSEGYCNLELKIPKSNGIWEVRKPMEMDLVSSRNHTFGRIENQLAKVMPMSSSATGSSREGEDPSVNQDGGGHFDFSVNNGNEFDSISLTFDQNCGLANRAHSIPLRNPDVIVLTDSDEENEDHIPPVSIYDSGQAHIGDLQFSNTAGIPNLYVENTDPVNCRSSSMDLLDGNGAGMSIWPSTSSVQAGSGFQLFHTESGVPDTCVDIQQPSITFPTFLNDFMSDRETATGSAVVAPGKRSDHHNDTELNVDLLDNPMAFGGDDPSLRLFPPSQPAGTSMRTGCGDIHETSKLDNWISLRLGGVVDGDSNGGRGDPATTNGLNSEQQYANESSLLLNMNDGKSDTTPTKRQRSESPFVSFHQPSSLRLKRYLSVDSDTE
ncbi:hypothetical protein Scep_015655 [Stephania cephalantha]|uniref:E3 SUMO-protein ligase SIZ1 n=1 Tax=Stephania cephalantha TaxID=152367 RepID=A0AAP0J3J8_9MAGN